MATWIPVYVVVPSWCTFRWFQVVFPINNTTVNIFVQLSLCREQPAYGEFPGI